MKGYYIIKCENGGHPWWIADCAGDPGRTVVEENAQQFKSLPFAKRKKAKVVREYPERKLEGRLQIEYVAPKQFIVQEIYKTIKPYIRESQHGMLDDMILASSLPNMQRDLVNLVEKLVRQGVPQPVLPCDRDILYCAMAIVNGTNERTGVSVETRQRTNDQNFDYTIEQIKKLLARQSA